MVLNPLAFDNQEEFEKALLEEGLKRGWTPIVVDDSMSQGALVVDDILTHISEQPWSSYTEADYSIEQWHSACLIHIHDGPPTSKTQCKLPVKTPNGALNRNGIHAAAAALAGARSPLKASPEQKAKAANALRKFYSQLGETPPDSLVQSAIDDILAHHGVKGMRWGHRSNQSGGDSSRPSRQERRVAKLDRRLEKTISSTRRQNQLKITLHNTVGPVVQSKVNQMNTKPEWAKAAREGKLKNPNSPEAKKYLNEYNKLYMNEMNGYLKGFSSASGRPVTASLSQGDFLGFKLTLSDTPAIKHSDPFIVSLKYIKDKNGLIIGVEVDENSLTQSAIDDILAHHGVKGMKWGVRRKATVDAREVIVSDKRKKIKTSGGKGRPATSEAIKSREIGQVAKKSGTKALTNAELKAFNERLNLEQNFKRLQYQDSSAGKKFVLSVMKKKGGPGIETVGKAAIKSPKVRAKVASGVAALALAV